MNGNLEEELRKVLMEQGAKLVGYADLSGIMGIAMPAGVAVAVPVPVPIIEGIEEGPTLEYQEMYHTLNRQLNNIVSAGAKYLQSKGYEAAAQTTDAVEFLDRFETRLPHKTVAVKAGLGWIGKSCLLVTPEYGSAVRISSLLTNAPLTVGQPMNESRCGGCHVCVDACPGKALTGKLWAAGMERKELVDHRICYETELKLMKQRTNATQDLCGKCFVVCPFTRRYMQRTAHKGE